MIVVVVISEDVVFVMKEHLAMVGVQQVFVVKMKYV